MQVNFTTFVFELINFVLLTWILGRFVYRPIAAAIRARRDELTALRATTAARLAEVEARQQDLVARETELGQLREQIFAEATTEAAAIRARMLARARDDASAERERVQALLDSEREAALAWVRDEAVDQGVAVAGQMMLQLVPDAVHAALVARLRTELAERAELLRAAPVDEVELTVAHMPTPAELDDLRQVLIEAVGQRPRITIEEDERLLAGAVLRIGGRVLDASVRGQLELLRDDARQALAAGG